MSLFVTANHMLVLYCVVYAIGDMLRAFWFKSDTSDNAVAISVIFWLLSIWLLINSVIYYKAFLQEMRSGTNRRGAGGTKAMEGTGVAIAQAEAASTGSLGLTSSSSPTPDSAGDGDEEQRRRSSDSMQAVYRRWTFYLNTEVGLAYFLNIVGSLGYFVSSLISLFLTVEAVETAREVDRASLFLDVVNMTIFTIDGVLFWHVWWKENEEPTVRGKMKSVYFWANLCNTFSSVAYFVFVSWSLRQRYRLEDEESSHLLPGQKVGDSTWYDDQLIQVTYEQRSMYFATDLLYLVYAILLEIGWSWEHGKEADEQSLKLSKLTDIGITAGQP